MFIGSLLSLILSPHC